MRSRYATLQKKVYPKKSLMKILLPLLLCFLNTGANAQQKLEKLHLFAQIENDHIKYVADTVAFKRKLTQNLFGSSDKYDFIISVVRKKILNSPENIYCMIVHDQKQHIKVARFLHQIDNKLYLNDNLEDEDLFEAYYRTCKGIEDCEPNVIELEGKLLWTCGESTDLKCRTPEQASKIKCQSYTSISTN